MALQTLPIATNKWIRWCAFLYLALADALVQANDLAIQVLAADGKPIADAVVYAIAVDAKMAPFSATKTAVVDQQNRVFIPHVLAVPVGTRVEFKNTDSVNHYVYSFSSVKKFQIKLFKADTQDHTVLLDQPGLITLGCNIHDFMLGYIFVAPTPFVGVSDSSGWVHLPVSTRGEWTLSVWHERSNEDVEKIATKITLTPEYSTFQLHFTQPLKPVRLMTPTNDY